MWASGISEIMCLLRSCMMAVEQKDSEYNIGN